MNNIEKINHLETNNPENITTGWENIDGNQSPEDSSWDNLGEEHSTLDESKFEKDIERLSEVPLDYGNILKVIFEASEDGVDYDLECSGKDEYLNSKIIENLREISSISPTEDEDIWRFAIRDTIFIDVSRSTGEIKSVNKLTSFELRSLAQGKENGVPFSRERLTDFRPKTDLHTHFAGALTPDALIEVGKKHDILYPARFLVKAGIDTSQY